MGGSLAIQGAIEVFDAALSLKVGLPYASTPGHIANDVRMVPISFGSCFGWVHAGHAFSRATGDIVLCPTLGQEARHVHRQWRIMADRLAALGHTVLRFDYPDTGDSWREANTDLLELWIDSIVQAATFLHDRGSRHITLVGLRLGATLAALAQSRIDQAHIDYVRMDRLVMLAPVVTGRLYIREMRAFARMSGAANADDIEASGLQLCATTSRAISAIDLNRDIIGGKGPVLILDPANVTNTRAFAMTLRNRDKRQVIEANFDDFDAFVQNAHTNIFPEHSFGEMMAWLAQTAPTDEASENTSALTLSTAALSASALPDVVLHPPGVRERPYQFGEDARLFGMLCEPCCAHDRPSADYAVIFCNNGSNPHHGHGRFAVTCGRDMARAGISSFRFDFAGLGDSAGSPDEPRPHLFDAPRERDLAAAMSLLERSGYRRFILMGICAGAYHAFHGALADKRVVAIYGVNLPKFRWHVGDDPDQVIAQSMHATSYYVGEIRRRKTWQRLLRNDIDVRAVSVALLRRLSRRIATSLVMPLALRFGSPSGTGFPRWALAALSRRGVRVHLLYGHDDPGVEELVRCFGTGGRKMSLLPGCSVEIPEDVDHAISHARGRAAVQTRLLAFVKSIISANSVP